jgi:phage major head subunit gpT-like protein
MGSPAQYPTISDRAVVSLIVQSLDGAAANSWVPEVANQFSSNQATETYAGVGVAPAMREWLGEKQIKRLKDYSLTITNKDWESTLGVYLKDLNRDKTGQLMMKINELSQRGVEHDAKLLSALINTGDDGDDSLAYDGQFFFDTDHVVNNSGTINNDISVDISALPIGDTTGAHGTTTAPSAGEMALSILTAIQSLYGFKDDQGEPTNQNAKSFVIMVPTTFWAATQSGVSLSNLTQGFNNPLANFGMSLKVVQNPRLSWTTAFAVFVADQSRKPLIAQVEDGPRVEVLGEGSDHAFKNKEHLYSVIKSGNVGYGAFDKAVLVTLT